MPPKRKIVLAMTLVCGMMITGCTMPPGPNDYVYEGENYGANRTDSYKQGVRAGCKTALGNYTKNHKKFNTLEEYNQGWFAGRRRCQGPIW